MNDFSVPSMKNFFDLPASPGNFIQPQKRPQSSMSPTIVTDTNGKVRLVVGAAGGTKIPTSISMVRSMIYNIHKNVHIVHINIYIKYGNCNDRPTDRLTKKASANHEKYIIKIIFVISNVLFIHSDM